MLARGKYLSLGELHMRDCRPASGRCNGVAVSSSISTLTGPAPATEPAVGIPSDPEVEDPDLPSDLGSFASTARIFSTTDGSICPALASRWPACSGKFKPAATSPASIRRLPFLPAN